MKRVFEIKFVTRSSFGDRATHSVLIKASTFAEGARKARSVGKRWAVLDGDIFVRVISMEDKGELL